MIIIAIEILEVYENGLLLLKERFKRFINEYFPYV